MKREVTQADIDWTYHVVCTLRAMADDFGTPTSDEVAYLRLKFAEAIVAVDVLDSVLRRTK